MATPVLHVVAGPNGAGKTTFYERVLGRTTYLPFLNADRVAAERWPEDPGVHAYEAAAAVAEERRRWIAERRSFATETVFSHPSKLDLIRRACEAGYRVSLHVVLIPEALAPARVAARVEAGGHDVPEEKIRQRYRRLWQLVSEAVALADETVVLDNSRAETPFRVVARFEHGRPLFPSDWPAWTPEELRALR